MNIYLNACNDLADLIKNGNIINRCSLFKSLEGWNHFQISVSIIYSCMLMEVIKLKWPKTIMEIMPIKMVKW